jgi:CheY-like chemotaxis protein
MRAVRLAAWNQKEGALRFDELKGLGFQVVYEPMDPEALLRTLEGERPGALVIDLSRSPALGRDVGVAVRVRASTRAIPLVFVGGSEEKADAIRKLLPDAEFSSWKGVGDALKRAMELPPKDPIIPDSAMAGYSGTPLPKKLGIKSSVRVLLAGAPTDFPDTLGPLPEGAALTRRFSSSVDLVLWFVRSQKELGRDLPKWVARVPKGGMWIIWPKKSSGFVTDLRQDFVRRCGLDAGLVDYKIAAVDSTWSGLKFAVRKVV